MKKFCTLLFLLMTSLINVMFAGNLAKATIQTTPLVWSAEYMASADLYFPWTTTLSSVMMAACPGDISVTADPGECSRVINYDFDLVPENPPSQEQVTQNINPNLVNATIFCPNGQTRYKRTFQNTNTTNFTLETLVVGVYQSSNSPSIMVNVYSQTNELLYAGSIIVPNLSMSTFNVSLGNTVIPAGESYSVEVVTPPPFVSIFRMGRNDVGNTTNEAMITSETCNGAQMVVSGAAMANSIVMSVLGTADEFIVINNSPYPYESGDEFPVGVYDMNYQVYNWEGDEVLDCQFTISVFSFQAQNTAMACNDQVNVTLGTECFAEIGADAILKGDFYSCFDDYTVEITSIFGTSLGNTVSKNNIGQTLKITVTAPDGNSCWGHILVEDKFGPQLVCNDVYTTCVGDLTPGSALSSRINLPADMEDNILFPGAPNSRSYTIPVQGFGGIDISNIGVHLNVSHTRVSDLAATVMAPNGMMATLFVSPGSNAGPCDGDNIIVDIFDDAIATNAELSNACAMSVPAINGEYKPLTSLSVFDGISANGNWVITIHDLSNGEGGTINEVSLSFDQEGASIPFPYDHAVNWVDLGNNSFWIEDGDNCTNAYLTYEDQILQEGCEGPYVRVIQRCWGGFDEYNNPANGCCQTIYVYRNGLSAIIFPPNYDDIQEPALSCAIYGDSIPGLDVTGSITGDLCYNIQIVPYTDVILPICKRSYKIIRTHKVIEWCNSTVLEHNQIIKVVDHEGPELACPDDLTVSTNIHDCYRTLTVDKPEILFDCSDNFTYNLEHGFGPYPNNFPCVEAQFSTSNVNLQTQTINNIPVGSHFYRWTVVDECGNSSQCCSRVTVEDQVKPTAVCHDVTVVSIAANQEAIIKVESFDDGSHDNCAIEKIEVRKMTNTCVNGSTTFGPQAVFCCREIGLEVMVEMRVTDIYGNTNTCMVRANVQDKLPPYVKCPKDVTLDCQADYNDLDLTGEPDAVDNCSVRSVTKEDDPNLSQCGTGTIRRVWTAEDYSDWKHSCVQTITLIDVDPFDEKDIIWPQNYYTNECGAALLPENLPMAYARPKISDDECSLVGVHYKDQVFTFVDGACEKILRTWTVLDWCTYNEAYPVLGQGWYEHVQIIKMHNEDPPIFETACVDVTVYSFGHCEGEVTQTVSVSDECTPFELIKINYSIDVYNDNIFNFFGSGYTFTRILPDGVHKVRWTAEDKCGNIEVCEYLITVIDGKKPTPYCLSSVTTAVMNSNGQVEIWAKDFDLGSTDNCTVQDSLWFTFDGAKPVRSLLDAEHYFKEDGVVSNFAEYLEGVAQKWIPDTKTSGRLFTCSDIPNGVSEQVSLDMSVTDEVGNIDFCTVTLVLQDNSDVCDDQGNNLGSISGRVTLADNRPLKEANIVLESNQTEYPKSMLSGQTGAFQYNNLKRSYDYQMSAQLNSRIDAGVSTLDLVFIQRHIIGLQLFDNPYNVIAADIDGNEKLNSVDLVNLRKVILGSIAEFPNNQQSWKIIPANTTFPSQNNPWPVPTHYSYHAFAQSLTNQNFIAIKLGDVNNSIVLNVQGDPTEVRSADNLVFKTEAVTAREGQSIKVPVYADGYENILGYQFTAHVNEQFTLEHVEAGAIDITPEHMATFENMPGVVTMAWHTTKARTIGNEPLFYLILKVNDNVEAGQVFTVDSEITQAMAFDENYKAMNIGVRTMSTQGVNVEDEFIVRQNVPNPFSDQTVISFTIPTKDEVQLKVMDVSGRLILSTTALYEKGSHEIILDKSRLNHAGVLYYQISSGQYIATKKMILIE